MASREITTMMLFSSHRIVASSEYESGSLLQTILPPSFFVKKGARNVI